MPETGHVTTSPLYGMSVVTWEATGIHAADSYGGYYPAAGSRSGGSGGLDDAGWGYYRVGNVAVSLQPDDAGTMRFQLSIHDFQFAAANGRGHAFSIRCVVE
jgi:hypothetical protein